MNELEQAVLDAADHGGAPAKVWHVGADAAVSLSGGTGHPYDGMTVTHWSVD
ncbi:MULTISPECIES: hypothetical protein [Mycolicibacterium]|uniref:hypothetical protein n=1 Tax=Mycolicibacterium TaxID=1866885 RepID=UPI000A99A164|nr:MULTISPECIES: hypothetical protein [Mycolicibacterium]